MTKCVVIADDLTGANATGVLLKKLNYNTATIMNSERIELKNISDCECVTFPTDSRGVDKIVAYNRVYNVAKLFSEKDIILYSKRIDSTLRGNLGSEADAILDVLGKDYITVVVPCAPASGRITIGGYMLVNDVPLHRTEAALDPKTPIKDSQVETLFKKQTKYAVESIYMKDLMQGKKHLIDQINLKVKNGARIIIIDSVTQEDIDLISEAVIDSKLKFIAIDPGSFTATLAQKLIVPQENSIKKNILAVVGSVNPVAKLQMENLWLSQPVYNVFVDTKQFLGGKEFREKEIARVTEDILEHTNDYELFSVTGDGIYPEHRLDLDKYSKKLNITVDEISNLINTAMAEIAYQILKGDSNFRGIYTSGGDITAAICKRVNTSGLNLQDEVIPLAACGTFIKGDFPGMLIVTKGGMTGDSDAINKCFSHLKGLLNM